MRTTQQSNSLLLLSVAIGFSFKVCECIEQTTHESAWQPDWREHSSRLAN